MSKPFNAGQFTATKFHSAEDKAKFANDLVRFIQSGFIEPRFTKKLYVNLSNCFSHIAHFDRAEFYDEWFSSDQARKAWVMNALEARCYGSPEYTFCDVERAIQKWLSDNAR